MTLRPKTLLLLGAATLCLVISLTVGFDYVLLKRFSAIEEQEVRKDLQRTALALENEVENTAAKLSDWSQWDDTYSFLKGENDRYLEANVTYSGLKSLQLSHMLWFRTDGTLLYGVAADDATEEVNVLSSSILLNERYRFFISHKNEESSLRGIIFDGSQFFIAASQPVLTTNAEGPIVGTIVFMRPFDEAFVAKLGEQTRLAVAMRSLREMTKDEEMFANFSYLSQGDVVRVIDQNSIVGFHLVKDIFDRPAAVFRVDEERGVYQQGVQTRDSAVLFLVAASLIFAVVILVVLDRTVIARIEVISKKLQEIAKSKDISQRVPVTGRDEVTSFAQVMNTMLEALRSAQEQLEAAKRAAEAANEAKGRFVANISHELRTPIHGIIGMIRILLNMEQVRTKREYLTMAKDSATALLSIINDILDLSKIEAGKLTLEPCAFDPLNVVRDAFRTIASKANEKGLLLLHREERQMPSLVNGDPVRLKQVLVNLLGNAVKFTEHGTITLATSVVRIDDGEIEARFAVTDTGIGIPEDKQAMVFEAFTQADDTSARKAGGTGLGLNITMQLVELMGGRMSLESELGKGSTFSFTARFAEVPDEDLVKERPQVDLTGMSALLYMGAPELEELYKERLALSGAEVLVCSKPDAAAQWVRETSDSRKFVLVIGGGLFGDKTPQYLSGLASSGFTPVVMLAADDFALSDPYLSMGVSNILVRPVLPQDLVETLQTIRQGLSGAAHGIQRKLRILVADDAKTNRMILKLLLESWGHTVELAENGKRVVELLEQSSYFDNGSAAEFDVLLLDIQMPVMDGIAACKVIREREERCGKPRLPLIAATANAGEQAHSQILQSGFDCVVTKPIEPENLQRAFVKVLPADAAAETVSSDGITGEDILDIAAMLRGDAGPSFPEKDVGMLDFLKDVEAALGPAAKAKGLCSNSFDAHELLARFQNDASAVRQMIGIFLEEQKELVDELSRAVAAHDPETRRSAAHAVKGALLNVSAVRAAEHALRLERMPAETGAEEVSSEFAILQTELELLIGILDRIVVRS